MSRLTKLAMVAFALVVLMGSSVTVASAAAPFRTGDMEVQVWPGVTAGQVLLIVGVTLPEKTPLPATVRIPIVPGTNLAWAGEITTDSASADIAAQPKIVKGKGADYAEFEIKQFRHAQIELGGLEFKQMGSVISGEVQFVQAAPANLTGFAVRVPATASDLKITPAPAGEPRHNSAGESLYTLPNKVLKTGERVNVEFSYDTALPSAKAPMDTTRRIILVLSVLVGVVVVGLIAMLALQRARSSRA